MNNKYEVVKYLVEHCKVNIERPESGNDSYFQQNNTGVYHRSVAMLAAFNKNGQESLKILKYLRSLNAGFFWFQRNQNCFIENRFDYETRKYGCDIKRIPYKYRSQ